MAGLDFSRKWDTGGAPTWLRSSTPNPAGREGQEAGWGGGKRLQGAAGTLGPQGQVLTHGTPPLTVFAFHPMQSQRFLCCAHPLQI